MVDNPPARPRWRRLLLQILAASALAILLVACATTDVGSVSLKELVSNASSHDGEVVRTEGDVHQFRDGPTTEPYLVLEDSRNDRVLLTRTAVVSRYVNRHVVIEGCFAYTPGRGQRLAVGRVVQPAQTNANGSGGDPPPCRRSMSST